MHAKSGLRVVLEWKIYRPDSVIAAVIPLIKMIELNDTTWSSLSVGVENQTGEAVSRLLEEAYASAEFLFDRRALLEALLFDRTHSIHEAAFAAYPHLIEIARTHNHPDTRFRSMEMAARILAHTLGVPESRAVASSTLLAEFDTATEAGSAILKELISLPRPKRERTFEYLAMVASFVDKRPGVAYILTEMSSNGIGCPLPCCDEGINIDDLHPYD